MDRRSFLRSSCLGCTAVLAGGGLLTLGGCSTLPVVKVTDTDGVLRVPISAFAESTQVLARSSSLPFDVLVMAQPRGGYRSVYLRCSHRDQPLTATMTVLHCSSHGSRFALDGTVLEGPADKPLHLFPTTNDATHVSIDVKH